MSYHRKNHAATIVALFFIGFCSTLCCSAQTPYTLSLTGGDPGWKLSVEKESDTSCIAIVRDNEGLLVDGLRTSQLAIAAGGKQGVVTSVTPLQETRQAEFRVVLVIDNSASMLPRLDKVFRDMNVLMGELSNNIDISVVSFSDEPMVLNGQRLHVRTSPFIRNIAQIKQIYTKAMKTEHTSRTFLYDAVYAASVLLKEKPAASGKMLKTYVILISDGQDIGSEVSSEQALEQIYSGGNAPVFYTVDYLTASNKFLRAIAEKTGGKYYAAKRADDLAEIFSAVAKKTFTAGYRVLFSWSVPPSVEFTSVPEHVVIERSVVREAFPLLPYIFFDENSAEIPSRYRRISRSEADAFTAGALPPSALDYYYNVLNIIGSRLKEHPKATITVTGCNADAGAEQDNTQISQARAAAVAEYLTSVWNIAPNRITVEHRGLPVVPSNSRTPTGQNDNRRVEITSDTWEVIKPVVFSRTSYNGYMGDSISTVSAAIQNASSLREYRWDVSSGNTIVYTDTRSAGDLRNGAAVLPIQWSKIFRNSEPAENAVLSLCARTSTGDSTARSVAIPLQIKSTEQLRGQNIEKHRISLMLFDFNRSDLSDAHMTIIREFVHPLLRPASAVVVSGHTDNIGAGETNLNLSRSRASSVGKALRTTAGSVQTRGLGSDDPAFSNDLPEGRFYNRTVVVAIETPIAIDK